MNYHFSRFPMILERDINSCILDNYNSQKTITHMNNTSGCETAEGQQAFREGMIYAALLISTSCYQFSEVQISEEDAKDYEKFYKKKEEKVEA